VESLCELEHARARRRRMRTQGRRESASRARNEGADDGGRRARGGETFGRSVVVASRERERSGEVASSVHSFIHSFARWAFEFRARERRGET
jgi:hypothetical protein